jgi:hypothetical protein
MTAKWHNIMALQLKDCEVLSIISGTGAAICPAVVVK